MREAGTVGVDDPRFLHHLVLLGQGYVLDWNVGSIRGLRTYCRPDGGEDTVDICPDGSWGRYDERDRCIAYGDGADDLRKEFER